MMQGTYQVVSSAQTVLTCDLEPNLCIVGLKGSSVWGLVVHCSLVVVVASAGPVVPSELLLAAVPAVG